MNEADRIVGKVRGRLRRVRFLSRLQDTAALAFALVLLFGLVAFFAGHRADLPRNLLVGALAAVVAAVVGTLLKPVRREHAASEADRVLGTEERLSTALAVHAGRAEDPLGFAPALDRDAATAARACPSDRIRQGIRPRWRRSSWLALACIAAAVVVAILPLPGSSAVAKETEAVKKEREHVAEQARRLERKARRMEELATKDRNEELRKLAEKIRMAAARMAGEKPRVSKAMAELAKLEREARKDARRYAGMKAPRSGESGAADAQALKQLAKALEQLEKSDPAATRRQLNRLLDKIREEGTQAVDPKELQAALEAVQGLRDAAQALEALGMQGEEIDRFLEGLGGSESLDKLADAMQKLQEAMEKAGIEPPEGEDGPMTEEQMKQLAEQMRDYRMPELSEEQIQEMIRAAEELRKMIEAGEEISFCKGSMGSGMGMGSGSGLGLGRGRGMVGLGGNRGQGQGQGSGFRPGSTDRPGTGTGGAGKGRGGDPGVTKSDKPVNPDQAPGMINSEGTAQLIRTVRRIPDPDSEAKEYEVLSRAAKSEAEEAIKRGEIPRQYRGYIRRYFDDTEAK